MFKYLGNFDHLKSSELQNYKRSISHNESFNLNFLGVKKETSKVTCKSDDSYDDQ